MRLTAYLHPAQLSAEPGELARCELRLRNTSDRADEFTLEMVGEPVTWAWINPLTLRLAPGEEGTAQVRFRLPRGSEPVAGCLPFTVRAVPTGHPSAAVEADGTLDVAEVRDVSAVLRPPTSRIRRTGEHVLVIENRGNVTVRAALRLEYPDALDLRIEPPEVEVEPGSRVEARVEVRAARTLLASERRHDVAVLVDPEGAPALTVTATVVREGALPRWAPLAGGLTLLLAAVPLLRATVLAPNATVRAPNAGGLADGSQAAATPTLPACPAEGHLSPSGGAQVGGEIRSVSSRDRPAPRDYAFLLVREDGCSPVRFNACEPLHYVVNTLLAPSPEAVNDVHESMARLAEASGLRIVFDGTTDEVFPDETFPGSGRDPFVRPPYQPDRYGERWAPLLISWTSGGFAPPDVTGAERVIAGGGNPTVVDDVIVTGQVGLNADVVLDLETREPLPAGFGPGITWGRVLLHELGHVMGLGHVNDTAQLMHEPLTDHPPAPAAYAAGDRIGLRLIGREFGCLETPPYPSPGSS